MVPPKPSDSRSAPAVAMTTLIKTLGLRPPPQVNKHSNLGPAAPGPLLNTFQTLKTIFIVMATAAYLLNARLYNREECILAENRLEDDELRLAEFKLAEYCNTRSTYATVRVLYEYFSNLTADCLITVISNY